MKEIKYSVRKTAEEQRTAQVENDEFITVKHRVDGIEMWTAFVGKREGDKCKKTITISVGGGLLDVQKNGRKRHVECGILTKKRCI